MTLFTVPGGNSQPYGITTGPDGNLWFTELINGSNGRISPGGKIGRITPSGTITEFAMPTPNSEPWGITRGPDGNLWFTDVSGNKIGRITTSGRVTEFDMPDRLGVGIVTGPDGNLWVTGLNDIYRLAISSSTAEPTSTLSPASPAVPVSTSTITAPTSTQQASANGTPQLLPPTRTYETPTAVPTLTIAGKPLVDSNFSTNDPDGWPIWQGATRSGIVGSSKMSNGRYVVMANGAAIASGWFVTEDDYPSYTLEDGQITATFNAVGNGTFGVVACSQVGAKYMFAMINSGHYRFAKLVRNHWIFDDWRSSASIYFDSYNTLSLRK
ncbi:MAG: virginiamycin B lyase family protein, partial [Candidatus Dormibacteraceae bacterium]